MKLKTLLLGMTVMMATALPVGAATITTSDGVLSIETPSEAWVQTVDPNYWLVVSDGKSTITVDHLSNGEILPSVDVASGSYEAVYQAFVSTKNEVFVVKGLAASKEELATVMDVIGTIKVLKYDTKTAVERTAAAAPASQYGIRTISATYTVTADELNVRSNYSADAAVIGTLSNGDQVMVTGAVTKDGADFGWYQIQYNGSLGYISAAFLAPANGQAAAPAQTNTSAAGKQPLSEGFGVWRENGEYYGIMVPYSDGLFYTDNGTVPFEANGDGSYFGGAGAGLTLYNYNPVAGDAADKTPIGDGFDVWKENGEYFGVLVPYSDGQYYSNDGTVPFAAVGGGLYFGGAGAGMTLYSYDPTYSSANPEDKYITGGGFDVWKENGEYYGTLFPFSDGYYYTEDGVVPFAADGYGNYYGGAGAGMTLYAYNPAGEQVQCEYCGQWFQAGNDYRNHVAAAHGGAEEMVQCEYCGEWFQAGNDYRNHVAAAHGGETGTAGSNYYENEGEEMVQCEYCGEWFYAGSDYRNHVAAAHSDQF